MTAFTLELGLSALALLVFGASLIARRPDRRWIAWLATAGVLVLGILSAFVTPTRESNYRRTYPLANAVYIYINRAPGQPISPRVREFLAYILSREGQQHVVDDGMFLPLNPDAVRLEREKLR